MNKTISAEQRQIALKKIIERLEERLEPVGRYGAKLIMYVTALGAIAVIRGTNLAPELKLLLEGVGINLLSGIIERVARGESIPDSELQDEVEKAIQASNLEDLLTEDYFARALSRIVRNQNKILNSVVGQDYEFEQLSSQLVELKHLIEGLLSVYPQSSSPELPETDESLPLWLEVPQTPGFRGRGKELEDLEVALEETHRVIIYGISGTGKTWILARLARRLNADSPIVCWVGLNHYLNLEDIQLIIARFLSTAGLGSLSRIVRAVERANLRLALVKVLALSNVYLFFDSLDAAHPSVSSFIEELFEATLQHSLKGAILLSSTSIPAAYSQMDILQKKVVVIGLGGFSLSETEKILKDTDAQLSEEQVIGLYEAVGGHPMSVLSLAELFRRTPILSMEIEEVGLRGIEAARDWLLARVLGALGARERDILLAVSIFEYPFDDSEAQQIISSRLEPKYCLYPLMRRHLVLKGGEVYTVHDAIRGLAYDMLSTERREQLHRTLVQFYRDQIDTSLKTDGSIPFQVGFKWSFHLEQVIHFYDAEGTIKRLLNLDNKYLSALFAISYFGYPFDFVSEDLAFSRETCKYLLSKGLIRRRLSLRRKRPFVTRNLDFIDAFFLQCLCIRRGIGNHLGYFGVAKPNYAFRKQGIICPWEHCIELYPLPSSRRSDRDALDKSVLEMEVQSCPIFGHCCPGGKEQATTCRDNPNPEFVWALTE